MKRKQLSLTIVIDLRILTSEGQLVLGTLTRAPFIYLALTTELVLRDPKVPQMPTVRKSVGDPWNAHFSDWELEMKREFITNSCDVKKDNVLKQNS